MDFGAVGLDDNAAAFWAEVRDFLDRQLTAELRDHVRCSGTDYFAPFHQAMGARGWLFPGWPRNQGGAGLDAVCQHILALELSRRAAPVTVADTTFIGAHAVKTWGGDLLRSEVLPAAASGDARICLGYTEPDAGWTSLRCGRVRCRGATSGSSPAPRCSAPGRTSASSVFSWPGRIPRSPSTAA